MSVLVFISPCNPPLSHFDKSGLLFDVTACRPCAFLCICDSLLECRIRDIPELGTFTNAGSCSLPSPSSTALGTSGGLCCCRPRCLRWIRCPLTLSRPTLSPPPRRRRQTPTAAPPRLGTLFKPKSRACSLPTSKMAPLALRSIPLGRSNSPNRSARGLLPHHPIRRRLLEDKEPESRTL